MRLSIDDYRSDDPERRRLVANCAVYLDGWSVSNCVLADEEAGYVECYVPREQLPAHAQYWPTEGRFGRVTIIDLAKLPVRL